MDLDQRAKLLRERLRAVRGYDLPPYAVILKPEPKRAPFFNGPRCKYPFGPSNFERRPKWIKKSGVFEADLLRLEKQEHGKRVLTTITEKAPQKLKRVISGDPPEYPSGSRPSRRLGRSGSAAS